MRGRNSPSPVCLKGDSCRRLRTSVQATSRTDTYPVPACGPRSASQCTITSSDAAEPVPPCFVRSKLVVPWPCPGGGRSSPIRRGAVSYTHLRAHETGRNLVCRLLLEKKIQSVLV